MLMKNVVLASIVTAVFCSVANAAPPVKCPVPRPAPDHTCSCGGGFGAAGPVHKPQKGMSCVSADGRTTCGTYYASCTVVCSSSGVVPPPSPTCR
jgi:hypothetical protein